MRAIADPRHWWTLAARRAVWVLLLGGASLGRMATPPLQAADRPAADGAPATVWESQVAAGFTVIVTNHLGAIRCLAAQDAGLAIRAVARGGSLEGVEIETEADEAAGTLRIRLDAADALNAGSDSGNRNRDQLPTDLEIRVPSGIVLKLFSDAGAISAVEIAADVEAHSSSGEVVLRRIDGTISAATDSGPIEADLACATAAARQSLSSDSGDIVIQIPEDVDLSLQLTTSGPIRTDFSTEISHSTRGRPVKQGRAVIGRGGPPMAVTNRSGAVALVREAACCSPPELASEAAATQPDVAPADPRAPDVAAHAITVLSEEVPLRLEFTPELDEIEIVREDARVAVEYDRAAGTLRITASGELPGRQLALRVPARWQLQVSGGSSPVVCVVNRYGPRSPLSISTTTGDIIALVEHGVSIDLTVASSARVTTDYTIEIDHSWRDEPTTRGRIRFGGEAAPIHLDSRSGAISVLRAPHQARPKR